MPIRRCILPNRERRARSVRKVELAWVGLVTALVTASLTQMIFVASGQDVVSAEADGELGFGVTPQEAAKAEVPTREEPTMDWRTWGEVLVAYGLVLCLLSLYLFRMRSALTRPKSDKYEDAVRLPGQVSEGNDTAARQSVLRSAA